RSLIKRESVANTFRHTRDRVFLASEEMPAVYAAGPAVPLQVGLLLGGSESGAFARIETDDDDLVILAGVELQILGGLQNAIEHQGAKIRTLVIGEHENHRPLAE